MKLITEPDQLAKLKSLVPMQILEETWDWSLVESSCFRMHCDLLYFDVIHERVLSCLPKILRSMDEEVCYIVNHDVLMGRPRSITMNAAIEITADSDPDRVRYDLSNAGADHDAYHTVYYLVGRFSIVSKTRDWIIVAEPDDHAFLSSGHEIKYTIFNSIWWSRAANRENVKTLP